jgi:carboxyl-terminal processing protease
MTKTKPLKNVSPILIVLLFISLTLNGLWLADKYFPIKNTLFLNSPKNEILKYIQGEYIGQTPTSDKQEIGQIKGLVASLEDPYSEYLPKSEAAKYQDEINERYQGIGVRFKMVEGLAQITKVIEGSPAAGAGLRVGDKLVKVDDSEVKGLNLDEIATKVRGPSGSPVRIGVSRNEVLVESTITRAPVQSELLSLEFRENSVIITLTSFGNGLDEKMREVANKVLNRQTECQEGAKDKCINKVIFDLRSNTGGLLDQAVAISSYFLPENTVVLYEKTKSQTIEEKTSLKNPNLSAFPVFVLVDKYTASSAEVVTAALREKGKAKIVGQKTFGKGVVQKLFTLSNGDTLKLTIAEWLTPEKNQINKVGLKPDIQIAETEDALETALKLL